MLYGLRGDNSIDSYWEGSILLAYSDISGALLIHSIQPTLPSLRTKYDEPWETV